MTSEERIKKAIEILDSVENGNIDSKNLYDLQLHLSEALFRVKELTIYNVSKRLSIKLEDWHYQCGDGCCDMYGTEISLNDKVCDNQYAGDDVRTALEFVLTELGYDVDIDVC